MSSNTHDAKKRQVAISIATTGDDIASGHRVIEIGCIEIVDLILTGRHYHQYFNPERDISEFSLWEHGLTTEFLIDKPIFGSIAANLFEFIGDAEVITYNSEHVLGFIQNEITTHCHPGINWKPKKVTDILEIGKNKYPRQNNSLEALCKRYYVDDSSNDLFGSLLNAEIVADLWISINNSDNSRIISDISSYVEGVNQFTVETFSDFDNALNGISKTALCRGVSNHEYPLLPSLFRHQDTNDADVREGRLMWVFKTHARAYIDRVPASDLEWLTIAQHHGLPTRLLDWSLSPLVACFFAVNNPSQSDGAVYIYEASGYVKEEEIDILKLKKIVAFLPTHGTKRISAQSGVFTIHPTDAMKLDSPNIKKIVVPANAKKYFKEKLIKYGIHQATLFPDLDGLSGYIRNLNGYK